MANKTTRAGLLSPVYTDNTPHSLGGARVGGPTEGKEAKDPLGFAPFNLHTPAKGKKMAVTPPEAPRKKGK